MGSGLGPILTTGLKFWHINFLQFDLLQNVLQKNLVKCKVIGLFFRQRLTKDMGEQICAPSVWIELS